MSADDLSSLEIARNALAEAAKLVVELSAENQRLRAELDEWHDAALQGLNYLRAMSQPVAGNA